MVWVTLNVTIQTCYLLRLTCLHNLGTRFRVHPMFPHDGKNKHFTKCTKKYSVFISSFSPQQTMCEKCGFLSLTIYIKVGVKKERKKRGIPSTTEFHITNVFVTQKYRDLFYSLSASSNGHVWDHVMCFVFG
jgi:hypothetical protein